MSRFMLRLVMGLAIAAFGTVAAGQDALISELYGKGVHAYFARDYAEAHKQFTASIEQGSEDPRCYYFRGICLARLGRPDDAAADTKQGAVLELTKTEQLHDVSNSLQRIQGSDRIMIEKQRAAVRLEAARKAKALRDAMYEQWKQDEARVIRQPQASKAGGGLANPAASGPTKSIGPAGGAAKPAVVQPAAQAPAAQPPAQPPAKSGDDDPFGAEEKPAPPAKPAPTKPDDDDPFK